MKKFIGLFSVVVMLLIISCAGSSTSEEGNKYAGEINGVKIDRDVFTTSFLGHYRILRKDDANYKATDEEIMKLEDITWKDLTRSTIINEFKKEHDIVVTQQEVLDSLLTNPPKYYTDNGAFDVNGVFNYEIYKNSIETNKPVNTSDIKYNYYNKYIPVMKITQILKDKAEISKSVVEDYYDDNYASYDIDILSIPLDSYKPIVTNKEIEIEYRKTDKSLYYEPNLKIKYITKKVKPSKKDLMSAKTTIDSLHNQLYRGLDFDTACREFSSNLGKYPLGKLPFTEIENLPSIIRDDINGLAIGSITYPLLDGDIWYIYKILEKTKTMVKLQELNFPIPISHETRINAREELKSMGELIKQIGIEETASEYGCLVHSVDTLNYQRVYVEDLGSVKDLIEDAVTKSDGYIYKPIYNKRERVLVLVQIIENKLLKKKPLEEVRDLLYKKIESQKQQDILGNKLKNICESYDTVILEQDYPDVEVANISDFSKNYLVFQGLEADEIMKKVMKLEDRGDYTDSFIYNNTINVIYLNNRQDADNDYFDRNYYVIRGEYRDTQLDNVFETWFDKEVENAKVYKWFSMMDLYKRGN